MGVLEAHQTDLERPRIFYSKAVAEDLVKRGLAVKVRRHLIRRTEPIAVPKATTRS